MRSIYVDSTGSAWDGCFPTAESQRAAINPLYSCHDKKAGCGVLPGAFAPRPPSGFCRFKQRQIFQCSRGGGSSRVDTSTVSLGCPETRVARASGAQRVEFIKWLKAGALKRVGRPIATSDGRLRSDVRAFLSHWVTSNRSKPGRIMKEIGFSVFDYTLASALSGKTTLRPAVIPKLGDWLTRQD